MGESIFTDENGEYDKNTDHKGAGTLEVEKPGFVKQVIPIDIPEEGTLVQDAALEPIVPPPAV